MKSSLTFSVGIFANRSRSDRKNSRAQSKQYRRCNDLNLHPTIAFRQFSMIRMKRSGGMLGEFALGKNITILFRGWPDFLSPGCEGVNRSLMRRRFSPTCNLHFVPSSSASFFLPPLASMHAHLT